MGKKRLLEIVIAAAVGAMIGFFLERLLTKTSTPYRESEPLW